MSEAGGVEGQGAKHKPSALEAARYIADLSTSLSTIARRSGLDVVAYLLDLVRLEAEENAQNAKPK